MHELFSLPVLVHNSLHSTFTMTTNHLAGQILLQNNPINLAQCVDEFQALTAFSHENIICTTKS